MASSSEQDTDKGDSNSEVTNNQQQQTLLSKLPPPKLRGGGAMLKKVFTRHKENRVKDNGVTPTSTTITATDETATNTEETRTTTTTTQTRPPPAQQSSSDSQTPSTNNLFSNRSIIRMLNSSSDPALLVDESGTIIRSNAPSRSLFHATSSHLYANNYLMERDISSLIQFQKKATVDPAFVKSSRGRKKQSLQPSVVEVMKERSIHSEDTNLLSWGEVLERIAERNDEEGEEDIEEEGEGYNELNREIPATAHCLDHATFPVNVRVVDLGVATTTGKIVYCLYVTHDTDNLPPPQSAASVENGMFSHVEDVMQGVFDASFDPIFSISESGIILTANRAALKTFGYKENELLGKNISMICGGGHGKNHDKYLERYIRTGEKKVMGIKRELPARRKDGSEFSIELGLCEMFVTSAKEEQRKRVFYGFIQDITHMKEHQLELERKQKFCERIIEASIDGLFVICEKGMIHMVNDASARVFGWSKDELLNQNISKIMPEISASEDVAENGHIEKYCNMANQASSMVGKYQKVEAVRKDGTSFPVTLGITQVEGSDEDSHMYVGFVHDISHEKKIIDMEVEKTAAELLLNNMLPEEIALRLKVDPSHIADSHLSATILFADIVGFTKMSSTMSPTRVVSMLNDLFSMFDELVDKYGLNKVKTIGDCYMVTNVPMSKGNIGDECARICHFGLDMIDALHKFNDKNPQHNLNLRVGINFGPVVAGVVGTKRFLYDLWGDAVNLASRMESTGVPGKIQVTEEIVHAAKKDFIFESRGIIDVKGKGKMEGFLLVRRKSSSDNKYAKRNNLSSSSGHASSRSLSLRQSLAILSLENSFDLAALAKADSLDDLMEGDEEIASERYFSKKNSLEEGDKEDESERDYDRKNSLALSDL